MKENQEKLLCYCVPTTYEELRQAIEKYNLATLEEVQKVTEVCTGCRSCYPEVLELLAKYGSEKRQL